MIRPKLLHQSLVVLQETEPLVWRRMQLPERYSFWDLHVAIQDAMGSTFTSFVCSTLRSGTWCPSAFPTMTTRKTLLSYLGGKGLRRSFFERSWHSAAMHAYDFIATNWPQPFLGARQSASLLREANADLPPFEVDVGPFQRHDFANSHSTFTAQQGDQVMPPVDQTRRIEQALVS